MDKQFIKLIKSFLNDKKYKGGRTFIDFKRWLVWNDEYGYMPYWYVQKFSEMEYNRVLTKIKDGGNDD